MRSWLLAIVIAGANTHRLGYIAVENGSSVPVWVVGFDSMPMAQQEREFDSLDNDKKLDLAIYASMMTDEPKNTHWQARYSALGVTAIRRVMDRLAAVNEPSEAASVIHLLRLFAVRFHGRGFTDDDIALVNRKNSELNDSATMQEVGFFLQAVQARSRGR